MQRVPQGSILSVTLFGLRINSIVKNLTAGTECALYVDDFVICYRSLMLPAAERQLQQCLNRLQRWADRNGFAFSKSKTVCVHFCNKRGLFPQPTLTLNGSQIPVVDETKFLGVIFDRKLNFRSHIAYLRDRSLKSLNLLKVVANTKWGADRDSLLQLYRALIRSKLDYGCVVYGSARPSYLESLEPVANKALRLCLGAFRTSPIDSLQVEANEPSLTLRREQLSLQYAARLQVNPKNPAYSAVFEPKYEPLFGAKPRSIPPFGIRIATALHSVNPHNIPICKFAIPPTPPWTLTKPTVLLDLLSATTKGSTAPEIYLSKFREILSFYPDRQAIYTDGSKVGECVACAAVNNTTVFQRRLPDGASIYSAELTAIILALDLVKRDVTQSSLFVQIHCPL